MDYKDLRNKTVFDFTDDDQVIKNIIGESPKDFYIRTCHHLNKLTDIQKLASLTNNEELYKAVSDEIVKAEAEWDDMCDAAQKNGLIID